MAEEETMLTNDVLKNRRREDYRRYKESMREKREQLRKERENARQLAKKEKVAALQHLIKPATQLEKREKECE